MSEMVERLAKLLCRADCDRRSISCTDCGLDWEALEDSARIAIEAMREPTFGMVTAGMAPHRNTVAEPGETVRETNVRNAYRAMIDAALD